MESSRRDVLQAALKDPDQAVQHAAAEALDLLDRYYGLDRIEEKLVSGSRQDRIAAIYVLQSLDCSASNALLMLALNDEDADVQAVAVQVVGGKQLPEALPVLVQCLKSEAVTVAVYAAEALGGYADERLIPYLQAICSRPSEELLCAALSALGRLGFVKSEAFICGYVHDLRSQVRCAAVRALGQLQHL